jgi:ATP-dependent DNA ligase
MELDGERCLVFLDPLTGTELRDHQNRSMLMKVPELSNIHKQVNARCILDGELIITVNGEPNFYEIERRAQARDRQKIYWASSRFPATFAASDILYHVNHEVTSWTVTQRKELLDQTIAENERLMVARYADGRGAEVFGLAMGRNLEGVVAKRKESRYYPDKRSADWLLLRNPEDEDYVACGILERENRAVSIVLGQHSYPGGNLNYKGQVTLGVSPEVFRFLSLHPRAEGPAFRPVPAGNERAVWIVPDLVVTVRNVADPSGSANQPVFKGFRHGMAAEECVAASPSDA